MDYGEMEAGREMDALVAEKVMGFKQGGEVMAERDEVRIPDGETMEQFKERLRKSMLPCPSCAALRTRLALAEKFIKLVRDDQASFQRWTLNLPDDVLAALAALKEGE